MVPDQNKITSPQDVVQAAHAHRVAGQFDEAEKLLGEFLELHPESADVAIAHAWLAQHRGNFVEALERWARVRVVARGNPVGYSAAVSVYQKLGQIYAATALGLDGLSRFPTDVPLLTNFAWLAHKARRWPEAVARWRAVRTNAPDSKLSYLQESHALGEMREFSQADNLLREASDHFPMDREVMSSVADLATRKQDWPKAWRLWRGVRIHFNDDRIAYLLESRALHRMEAFEEAELSSLAGLKQFPDDGEIMVEAARCATRLKNTQVALERWKRAHELAPQVPAATIGYAEALTLVGDLSRADIVLDNLNKRFPNDIATSIAFARHAIERSDWTAAADRWRDAYHKHPDNPAFITAAAKAATKSELRGQTELSLSLRRYLTQKIDL